MKNNKSVDIIKNITDQLKALRKARGMSHEELAKKSGVTRPAISHIEGGKRKPSLLMSLKLAEALGQKLSEIIRNAEEQENKK